VGRRPGVVEEMVMIARMWRGWVRTEQANAYVAYITGTGLREYAATPGNLGCQMWTRDLGDGRTEVLTVSWWESRAAIIGFAGSDIEAAVFYPEMTSTSSIARPRSRISRLPPPRPVDVTAQLCR
jgi:heme-degrading monooxygenase HmoA